MHSCVKAPLYVAAHKYHHISNTDLTCKQGPPPLAPAKASPSQADPNPLSPTQRSSAFTAKSNNPLSPKGSQDPGALRPDSLSQPGNSEQLAAKPLSRQAASAAHSRAPGMERIWSRNIPSCENVLLIGGQLPFMHSIDCCRAHCRLCRQL